MKGIYNMSTFLKCKRCGRTLKDVDSQRIGYGPICLKKLQEDKYMQMDLFDFESEVSN